jgi:uncharacterized protein YndB with AHSA1/START domain
VWKALTDEEELVRWFPLDAAVDPGEGGFIKLRWDDHLDWEHRIDVWEPPKHLVTSYAADPGFGGAVPNGDSISREPDEKVRLAVDYQLESRGGKTFLRLVHSGFLTTPDWDDEYDGVRCGWSFELFGLRDYLERHRGKTRSVAWARALTDLSPEKIWERLTGRKGLAAEGNLTPLASGDSFFFRTVHGDAFRGTTRASNPPKEFYGTVETPSRAIFRLNVFGFQGKREVHVWLSAYDWPRAEADALGLRWREMMGELFPQADLK